MAENNEKNEQVRDGLEATLNKTTHALKEAETLRLLSEALAEASSVAKTLHDPLVRRQTSFSNEQARTLLLYQGIFHLDRAAALLQQVHTNSPVLKNTISHILTQHESNRSRVLHLLSI